MSLNGQSQINIKPADESLSKRDQMKLDKAIKIIESQENPSAKSHKRRAHTHIKTSEPAARKQIKIDSHFGNHPSDDIISSSSHSRELASTTPPPPPPQTHKAPQHLNPSYSLPQGQSTLFNYLTLYSHTQSKSLMQKEKQDWTILDNVEGQTIQVTKESSSTDIYGKLTKKFLEMKDRIRQPFGKGHRQFEKKFLKKEFLME